MRLSRECNGNAGFTLTEIVIVLAIIGVLAAIFVPTINNYVENSKLRRAIEDGEMISLAIGEFQNELGEWPIWRNGSNITPTGLRYSVLRGPGTDPAMGAGMGWPALTGVTVDLLENHIQFNTPGSSGANAYPTGNGERAWRGPYMERFRPDPWGNRYLANVEWLWYGTVLANRFRPVFVISAGPNETIETAYSQTGPGLTVGGDDLVFRIK
jgi:prepilin-type N-terminal cleavage/methylation domain-containing protein